MEYRIYAKHKSQKTFRAIDGRANQVKNLIYAAIFSEEQMRKAMNELVPLNEDWKFEARKLVNIE